MSCNCCCTNTLDFCTVSSCGSIDLGIKAQEEGAYIFVLDFLGYSVTLEKEFEIDDEISFDVTNLNENMTYTGKLYAPSEKQIIITKDAVAYDCFKFKTVVNVTIAA